MPDQKDQRARGAAYAPYDQSIVTAVVRDLLSAWWDQLADDGRIGTAGCVQIDAG